CANGGTAWYGLDYW
nr:immunoglobulin heavy chain junction region [Macaca mulatta]MOV48867.1 immunoglobulin heavy chain junction region [Macaca mulatta]MOV48953.1 immunoglobulin heavy chain junction region [Macaca mulatta]MOV49137.1 immunoglobulin heavy chain junction region [Macaca mulatta]MOV49279.1 immunoglobulin heavy chain junction region [Macaca mulatta]